VVRVDGVAVPGDLCEPVQEEVEGDGTCHKHERQKHAFLGFGVNNFSKIREPHEVAICVDQEWSSKVPGLYKEESRIHSKDGGVGELKYRHQEGGEDVLTLPDALHHVMEMCYPKEKWTDDDCLLVCVVTKKYRHHACPESKLLAERSHDMVPPPDPVLQRLSPEHRDAIDTETIITEQHHSGAKEQDHSQDEWKN